jgi:hypothetical protein
MTPIPASPAHSSLMFPELTRFITYFYIGIILQLSLIIGIHRSVVIAKGCDNNNRMSFYESERRIRSDERPRTYI